MQPSPASQPLLTGVPVSGMASLNRPSAPYTERPSYSAPVPPPPPPPPPPPSSTASQPNYLNFGHQQQQPTISPPTNITNPHPPQVWNQAYQNEATHAAPSPADYR